MTDEERLKYLRRAQSYGHDVYQEFCRMANDVAVQAVSTPAIKGAMDAAGSSITFARTRISAEVERIAALDPVARAEKAEAEVERLKSASVAETQRFIDEVRSHQETADVAMRRTLSAEAEAKYLRTEYDKSETKRTDGLRRENQLKAEVATLRALCGEAAETLGGFSIPLKFCESRHALVVRLREVAKEVKP